MVLSSSGPELIAHRGASRERLENTLPAFALALERGADGIELDVHCTSDGEVVVHHDPKVGGRAIAEMPWSELSGKRITGDNRVPRLEDVLGAVGDRATVYVELKGVGIEDPVLDLLKRRGKRYAVHSFDHDAIVRAATKAPDVPRGVLLDRGTKEAAVRLRESVNRTKARDAWPHYSLVDRMFMATAAELGVRVIVWTVNTVKDAERMVLLGVTGLCTDDVRLFANL